jgi:hypothetical protein
MRRLLFLQQEGGLIDTAQATAINRIRVGRIDNKLIFRFIETASPPRRPLPHLAATPADRH